MSYLILAAVVGSFAVSFFLPIQWMLYVLFVYIGVEGMLKILSDYNPLIHVGADVLMGLILMRTLATSATKIGKREKIPPLTILFALHFVWFLITFLNPYALSIVASLAGMKIYVTMVLLYFFGYTFTRDIQNVKNYMTPWIIVLVMHTILSAYQAYVGPTSVTHLHPGYATQLAKYVGYAFRPFGFSAVAGGPAIFVFLTNSFVLYYIFESKKMKTMVSMILLACLCWLTLFVCQVRSAILKSFLSTGMFFIFYFRYYLKNQAAMGLKKRIPFRMLVIPLLITITLIYSLDAVNKANEDLEMALSRSYSTFDVNALSKARSNTMDRFMKMVKEVPFGAGLSRTGAAAGKFSQLNAEDPYFKYPFFTDNFFMAVLVDLGLPGLLIILLLIAVILIKGFSWLGKYHDPAYRTLAGVILCSLIASVFGFYGAEAILYNPEAAFFWFFSGVLMKMPELDQQEYLCRS